MPKSYHDLVIIGGGPAGLTAGLYAARSRLDAILIEKMSPGGQVLTTEWIENYPGFPKGISGTDLIQKMKSQAEVFGLKICKEDVLSIEFKGKEQVVKMKSCKMACRSVIIATGAYSRKLDIQGEKDLTGKGVSYCATCDGPFFSDCDIGVVGGGDMAVEEAIYLTKFAKKVYLIHRRDQLRATKLLQERALENQKIEVLWDTVVTRIQGNDIVERIHLKNVKSGRNSTLDVSATFVFIGTLPSTAFLNGAINLDNNGFIIASREMETNLPGVFAAGDVTNKSLRQISSAVGEGAIAASSAERYLQE